MVPQPNDTMSTFGEKGPAADWQPALSVAARRTAGTSPLALTSSSALPPNDHGGEQRRPGSGGGTLQDAHSDNASVLRESDPSTD
ncbi:hypothetical protein GCM10010095_70950 [Streptomyces anthocyanicus]|nr:hypothetical protein GCM10010095_70950 [Streptomyces anthocyanicus]